MRNPFEAQEEVFHGLLRDARYTEYGKKYRFGEIRTHEQFKTRIPLMDYDLLKTFVDRNRRGEQNLLWHTDIKWFAKSSGTTSQRSKYIPVSREALEECHYKAGKDVIATHYGQVPESKLYGGRSLMIGGTSTVEHFREDAYHGDLSAIIMHNLPFWVEMRRSPTKEIALMDNYEKKIEMMARNSMREDVRGISGVPSWTLVLLNRILEISGASNIKEIWPNLELYMHGGVKFTPYRERFDALIDPQGMFYNEAYNASEGFFAIQDSYKRDDMLLMLDYGVFYEFIPMDKWRKGERDAIQLHEVKRDTDYALVISTNAGLWRYVIGDTVRFTSLAPHRIKISGRTKYFINAFGEELIMDNVERALNAACSQCDAVVNEFTAGPVFMGSEARGGHEWVFEFTKDPINIDRFTEILDHELRAINSDYDAKRTGNMALVRPIVHKVPSGTFYAWMKKRGKLGGQNKVPRLANDRTYLDDLLVKEAVS